MILDFQRRVTSQHYRSYQRWVRDRGDERLRLYYPLSPDSVVLDAGGFKGDWAAALVQRFDPCVQIFEPVSEYAEQIERRFADSPKVSVHRYGLSCQDQSIQFSVAGDASSAIRGGLQQTASMRDIHGVLAPLDQVDLIKINIEGGEYDLLDRLIETSDIEKVTNLQVQFHLFVPDALDRYRVIASRLKQTHRLTWRYYFVWENWERVYT